MAEGEPTNTVVPDPGGPARHQGAAAASATSVAISEISTTVERMQRAVFARVRRGSTAVTGAVPGAEPVGSGTASVVDLLDASTSLTHSAIRMTSSAVAATVGAGLRAKTSPGSLDESPRGGATVAGISAAFGDHLSSSPATIALTTPMSIRSQGRQVAITGDALRQSFPAAGPGLAVFVHGLAATELVWGADYPAAVEPLTAVMLRYNTGVSVAGNGAALSELLSALVGHWPVPVQRLVLIGHSMGGLVIRAAIAAGEAEQTVWLEPLTDVVTLATPHRGAPMEKAASAAIRALRLDAVASPLADLFNRRSRGIKDLRFGAVRPQDWAGMDPDDVLHDTTSPLPLPTGVSHHGAVATLAADPSGLVAHTVGDGLVRPTSAAFAPSGVHRTLVHIPAAGHNKLLDHPEVVGLLQKVAAARTGRSEAQE